MSPRRFTTGLVLAAGGSSRLGRPKQLLPYRGGTLLGHAVGTARACGLDQIVVALGRAADEVLGSVDLGGTDVVVNERYGGGCSSSIAAALGAVDERCEALVLLLGDQPGVTPATVCRLLDARGDADYAVCAYEDGRGHPFAFGRAAFAELAAMHGDKAVWRLLEQNPGRVAEVPVPGPVPLDVDTWEDYRAVLAAAGEAA